jgi:hypothetical protein
MILPEVAMRLGPEPVHEILHQRFHRRFDGHDVCAEA